MTSLTPSYDHIVVVIEENHSLSGIIGNPQAPYIGSLVNGGALLTNYHAVTHPSQPNYFALYAGSTFGVADNADHFEPGPTLGSILQAGGKTFLGYIDTGSPRKHNPWESFSEGLTVERNFSAFAASDFSLLPDVSFIIPNLIDDMHDGTVAQGDQWLQYNLSGYAQWALTHNSLLIVVWDEDDFLGTNLVPAILYGAHVKPGQYTTSYNHYDLLNTLLTANHLQAPNNAANAMGIGNGVFINQPHGDFNGDGSSDILWRNDSGAVATWDMHDRSYGSVVIANVSNDWHIADTGDFNGDGNADILWRNDSGAVATWDMHDRNYGAAVIANVSNDWHIADIGDFNGDGNADILWRNDSGAVATWDMHDRSYGAAVIANVSNDWHIAGTGDFNGDGSSDILWRNDSGAVATWDMHDRSYGAVVIANVSNDWHIADTGDFNGDGTADILWRNDSGAVATWDMHDRSFGAAVIANMSSDWHIASTADFNGDGTTDIAWRNDSGAVATWNMHDRSFDSVVIANVPNDWHIV